MNVIIEMGGTKTNFFFDALRGSYKKLTIETVKPNEFKDYISSQFGNHSVSRIILGCFGPVSFNEKNYGTILNTPKTSWKYTNIYDWLKKNICSDIALVTDVTLPALGAMKKYQLQKKFYSYITVGTGIGGCNIFRGNILQNLFHPEFGHMYLGHSDKNICNYHSHCFEGQASGNFFFNAYKVRVSEVNSEHPGLLDQVNKVAKLVYNLFAATGVDCIVIGGGAIRKDMKEKIIQNIKVINNSYLPIIDDADFDQRLIIDEHSDDLALSGGIHLIEYSKED